MRKSIFKIVYLEKGKGKEVVDVEVSYDNRVKHAMIEVQGDKLQRSQVVKKKKIEDSFPINMQEKTHGWKLEAQYPANVHERGYFELLVNGMNFLDYNFIPLTNED